MTVKSRLLELLEQHKGETLSGEDIGRELSCTRAAVWKAVNSLRQEGYPIEAGPNKGYMLARESNLISAEGIRLFLEDPQVEIKIFDAISSTNLEARQLAVSGLSGPECAGAGAGNGILAGAAPAAHSMRGSSCPAGHSLLSGKRPGTGPEECPATRRLCGVSASHPGKWPFLV